VIAKCSYVMPYKEITKKEEKELITRTQEGCKDSENKLFNNKINLIIKLIQRYALNSNRIEMNDLVHEAYFGFRKAVQKYNGEYAFNTYLRQWVISKAQLFYHKIKSPMTNKIPVKSFPYEFIGGELGQDLMYSKYKTEPEWLLKSPSIDFNRFSALTKVERECVHLYINKQKSIIQIGNMRDTSRQAVDYALKQAFKKLKKHFYKNVLTYPDP